MFSVPLEWRGMFLFSLQGLIHDTLPGVPLSFLVRLTDNILFY